MNDNKWIDDLRHKEQHYQQAAPEGLWDDIARNLPATDAGKKTPAIYPWLRSASIAAAVALAIGLGWTLLTHRPQPRLNGPGTVTDIRPIAEQLHGNTGAKKTFETIAANTPGRKVRPAAQKNKPNYTSHFTHADTTECLSTSPESKASNMASDSTDRSPSPITVSSHDSHDNTLHTDLSQKKQRSTWQLSAYAGNIMTRSGSDASGLRPSPVVYNQSNKLLDSPLGANPTNDILTMNRGKDTKTSAHHNLPVRAGINASFPLGKRLRLESGVTYSYLSSTFTSGTESNYFDTDQSLHYIGIPLKLTCGIIGKNRWNLYAAAGAMVEKCIYGKASTSCIIGNELKSSETTKISEKRFQYSVNAAIGACYNVSRTIDVFVEPGISYYFDNHSDITNSYKDKPLNFDLRLGVRFNVGR